MKKMKYLLTTILLGTSQWLMALTVPGPIVDANWLANHSTQVQILEVRSDVKSFTREPEFETDKKTGKKKVVEVGGRIPDANVVNFKNVRAERMVDGRKLKYLVPEKADFEKLLQQAGINQGKPIILVPAGQDVSDIDEALRVYWQLKIYGEDNIAVLDGGMAGWLAQGRAFTVTPIKAANGNWTAKAYRSELVASSDDVANASKTGKTQLVDGRSPAQFLGISKRDYVKTYGHIAGAQAFAPELMTRSSDGALYFLKPNTYEALLKANGIKPNEPAISYCNSGHLASGPWFVMSELVGNKSTNLYDGSLYLWTLEGRPTQGVPLN